jgi:hypothetical protein
MTSRDSSSIPSQQVFSAFSGPDRASNPGLRSEQEYSQTDQQLLGAQSFALHRQFLLHFVDADEKERVQNEALFHKIEQTLAVNYEPPGRSGFVRNYFRK